MIFCLLAIPTFSFANSTNAEEPIVIPIGGVFVTNSDYNMEPTESETNVPIARAPAGSYVTSKVISSYIEKNKFIGYNSATPDWSYAIKYTLYTGKTYKFSASITTK